MPTDDNIGDALTFSLGIGFPEGASINSTTGVFTWRPTEGQDGNHTITVKVSDSANTSDSKTVAVTVKEVNAAPELAQIGDKSVHRPSQLTFTATATDDDTVDGAANTLTFSLGTGFPEGASINSTTGAFTWTPAANQVGGHTVKVQVSDGNSIGGSDSKDVTITVTESNAAPVLESIGAQRGDELSQITFIANATDDNIGDALTFSLGTGFPEGASINSTTGVFTWTPTEGQDGNHTITVMVSDSANTSDSKTVAVTVKEVNAAPELAQIGDKSVHRPSQLTFTATATDDDTVDGAANTLTFSLGTGFPEGASINSTTGAFTWTPAANQVGGHTVKVQVSDGNSIGGSDSKDVTITVTESNAAPVLESIGAQRGDELSQITFIANATDDNIGDALTFSLGIGFPEGASINSTTGVFTWRPTEGQDGNHTITVKVSDSANTSDSKTVAVTVKEVNAAPELAQIGDKSVHRPSQLTFTATATDDDTVDGAANTLTFSLGTGFPEGASINSTTGVFTWTPAANQVGGHTVKVQVSDGNSIGGSDSKDVTITVTESNAAPVLESIGAQRGDELSQITFIANATDDNIGDALTFSLDIGFPEGASINSTTGVFTWTPTERQDGNHTITVKVSDSANTSDSKTVAVTVKEVNDPPETGGNT